MFEKNKGFAAVFFLAGVILWVITNNVVFFIIGISTFAALKKAL